MEPVLYFVGYLVCEAVRDGVLAAEDRWVVRGFKRNDGLGRGAEAGLWNGGVEVKEWLDLGKKKVEVGIRDTVRAEWFDRELVRWRRRCVLVRKCSGQAVDGDT